MSPSPTPTPTGPVATPEPGGVRDLLLSLFKPLEAKLNQLSPDEQAGARKLRDEVTRAVTAALRDNPTDPTKVVSAVEAAVPSLKGQLTKLPLAPGGGGLYDFLGGMLKTLAKLKGRS